MEGSKHHVTPLRPVGVGNGWFSKRSCCELKKNHLPLPLFLLNFSNTLLGVSDKRDKIEIGQYFGSLRLQY